MPSGHFLRITLVSVCLSPGLVHASVEKGLYAPSTPEPVFLSSVDYQSDFEPVDDALQAKVSLSADLTVTLSVFGWAEYDWDKQTVRFDGYLGEEAAGEVAFLFKGQEGAAFQFKNGNAPATNWTYFDEPTIKLDNDVSWAIGGVYLPNTPEESFDVDYWSSGSFFGQDFQVQGGSPASGTQSLSFGASLVGNWTDQRIDIALEPGGPVVATFDDYQDIADLPLSDPGEGGNVSIYATYRARLTLTEIERRLAPKVNLATPYVHEIWPTFFISFPLLLEKEIVLPEIEVIIPGATPQGSETGTSGTDTTDATSGTDATGGPSSDSSGGAVTSGADPTDAGGESDTSGQGSTGESDTSGQAPTSGSDTSGPAPTSDGVTGGSGDDSGCACTSGRPNLPPAGLIIFGLISGLISGRRQRQRS